MKTAIRLCVAVLAATLIAPFATAQLSGDYYVGKNTAPGGYDADFPSLDSAITVLRDTMTGGVIGPTTFYLTDALYDNISMSRIRYRGASASCPVTIKPATGVKATINFTNANTSSTGQLQFGDEVYTYFSPSYFTIDGSNTPGGTTRDLTINFNGRNGIRVFVNSTHITIKNCNINVTQKVTTSSSYCIGFSMQYRPPGSSGVAGYFYPDSGLVENCVLTNSGNPAARGIETNRSSAPLDLNVATRGLIFRNNIINVKERGISMEHAINVSIYGNTIRLQQDSNLTVYGVHYERGGGTLANDSYIYANKIDTLKTSGTPARVYGISFGSNMTGNVSVYNNFITGFATPVTASGSVRGVSLLSPSASAKPYLYHNSIHIPDIGISTNAYGVYVDTAFGGTATMKNNIVAIFEGDDSTYAICKAATKGNLVSDRNVLFAAGGSQIGYWSTGPQATLANWRSASGQDASSKSTNPANPFGGAGMWKSATDLHFSSKPSNDFAGVSIPSINTDIDGHARGPSPYIGADEIPGSPLTGVATGQNVPGVFALDQNYPNPFNPETHITFQIPASAHVTLTVYNLLGEVVKVLAQGTMTQGTHNVRWDGTNSQGMKLASGVYAYQLQWGTESIVRKMILMR